MWGYLLLLFLFLILFSGSFYFGLREWLHPRDATPLPVDVEYVRVENYFGASFRAHLEEWLPAARPVPSREAQEPRAGYMLAKPNGERILVLPGGEFGGGQEHEPLIYCEGDLQLASRSTFHREIFCRATFSSESGVRLQAVAADGEVVLGVGNEVSRWVDARRRVRLGRGTVVHSRVSSSESIELEPQVSAQSLYAPLIVTSGYQPVPDGAAAGLADDPPAAPPVSAQQGLPAFLEGLPSSHLAPDTWLVQGDLNLPPGTCVENKLVVQGALCSGPDCHFRSDVKATHVTLGPRNQVLGNLISEDRLEIGESGVVTGNVVAETVLRLSAGGRIGREGKSVVVCAGSEVRMEQNVAVCGKVAAGRAVITL